MIDTGIYSQPWQDELLVAVDVPVVTRLDTPNL